jgi:hypothetical protein
MRPPRMTTRRWMLAAAVIALALGGHREANRLKQWRDACLMRATWHAEAEAYHRRLSATATARAARQVETDQEPTPSPALNAELDKVIEQEFGLPADRSIRSEGNDRFREARARQYALADRRRKILDDYSRKQSKYHAKQADYHAVLARKYRDAASRPWLAVELDPPAPQ